jgi:hypothetical protein
LKTPSRKEKLPAITPPSPKGELEEREKDKKRSIGNSM